MIKINLAAERKVQKTKTPSNFKFELGGSKNALLALILLAGLAVAGFWWYSLSNQLDDWKTKNAEAQAELKRLEEIRAKGEYYKAQKALLERKINLITDLKRQQAVPVHMLDQISKNLPEFLWLDSMQANSNRINVAGKATTYNAVSNFYNNLNGSGHFVGVTLGGASEVSEGVTFNLNSTFLAPGETPPEEQPGG
jgi:Tfp pilus assembly protein PilN